MRQLFLYGPPGSGKTTLGKFLAERLAIPFVDLDKFIEEKQGRTIPQIFAEAGEPGFRALEKRALAEVAASNHRSARAVGEEHRSACAVGEEHRSARALGEEHRSARALGNEHRSARVAGEEHRSARALACGALSSPCSIIALGGGTLLDPESRQLAEAHGTVVCLDCPLAELQRRIRLAPGTRPLVAGGVEAAERRLAELMARRSPHYASFPTRLDVADWDPVRLADVAEILFGRFRITSGDEPSDILVGADLLDSLGELVVPYGFGSRCVVVADSNTAPLYADRVARSLRAAGFTVACHTIPAGETTKTLSTVTDIWRAFLATGLGRADFAVAVGGGVVGDLTGFAAATWMRGIRWVNVSTTLLSMVDASTGGKTGCDLPEAKNLVGAFHSPSLVLADVDTLATLPPREFQCGLAESIKHAIISGDPIPVPHALSRGASDGLADYVSRSLAVKVATVRADPHEKTGLRAKLNLGHTVGHAVEIATDFQVKHGEAVAIGTVEEARLAVRLGLAPAEWPEEVAKAFAAAGLPTALPPKMDFASLSEIMRRDKKKHNGSIRFALPLGWGKVELVPVEL